MTHGNLRTPGGTEIPGVLNYREGGSLYFTADGATFGTFFREDEWTFIPDPPALPTTPGLYHPQKADTRLTSYRRLLLTTKGTWHWLDFTTSQRTLEAVEDLDELAKDYAETMTLMYGGA